MGKGTAIFVLFVGFMLIGVALYNTAPVNCAALTNQIYMPLLAEVTAEGKRCDSLATLKDQLVCDEALDANTQTAIERAEKVMTEKGCPRK